MEKLIFASVALTVVASVILGCRSTEDPPLKLGSTLRDLQSSYSGDGTIAFEYLSEDNESNFSGVVIPSFEVLDKRPDEMGLKTPNIQCLAHQGVIVECKRFRKGNVEPLEKLYGMPSKGIKLKDIGKEAFVKLRLPRIDFFGNFPDVADISSLSEQEQRQFSGRVRFSKEHEAFSYDIIDGEALFVEVSTFKARRWP